MTLHLSPRFHSPLFFAAFTALVLGPLLWPGYVLTFDMSWTSWLPAPSVGNDNNWVFYQSLHALGMLLPSWLIQKLLLVAIFWLSGWGAYRVIRLHQPDGPAAYLGGLLYLINPFIYTRLLAGQFLVLLGYALLPWTAAAAWRLLKRPGWRTLWPLALWGTALSVTSIHSVGLMAVVLAAELVAWSWGRWGSLRDRLSWLGAAVGLWLLANLSWFGPLVVGASDQAKAIAGFTLAQAQAFATSTASAPGPLAVAVLQGFWADGQGRYVLPSSTGWLFWLVAAALGAFVIAGLVVSIRRRDRLGLALAAAGLMAWLVAVGLAWAPTATLTVWAINHLPLWRGYREPQKWAALLALSYAYLTAIGAGWLTRRLHSGWREPVGLALLLLPLGLTPMLLWGAAGQLRSVWYPADWYQLRSTLKNEASHSQTLILPWHEYLRLGFAGRVVANPAPQFLGVPTVSSANPELAGVPEGTGPDSAARQVEDRVLAPAAFATDAAGQLHALGITRVVVLKETDWPSSRAVTTQPSFTLESETAHWQLWKVAP